MMCISYYMSILLTHIVKIICIRAQQILMEGDGLKTTLLYHARVFDSPIISYVVKINQ